MAEYIEREALLEKLQERGLCLCVSESDIKDVPTADVAPVVHGRWIGEEIHIETGDISATLQECSVCHRIRPVDGYCSRCGAKMDKEDK